jgi:hypothetical protein
MISGGEWEPLAVPWNETVWDGLFESGGGLCCLCDEPVTDRRFALGLQVYRAWATNEVETRFAHVDCLRRSMHHNHKLS